MKNLKKYFGSEDALFPFLITFTLCLILTINYLFFMIFYPYNLFIQSPNVLETWGQDNSKVVTGEIYRIFTSIWIHGNVVHLISNLLFLFIFGERLEELTDGRSVLLIFICSGIIGNIGTLFMFIFDLNFLSFGSSGAIFGLLGAVYYKIRGKSRREKRKALYLLILFFLITISQNVNIFSHLFGLLGGIITMATQQRFSIAMKNRKKTNFSDRSVLK